MKKLQKGEHVDKSIVGAHLLCMSTKFGFQNEDGKINKETLKKAFSRALSDQSKVDAAVEKCAVEKDDPQDTAIALGTCFRETAGVPGGAHHHHH